MIRSGCARKASLIIYYMAKPHTYFELLIFDIYREKLVVMDLKVINKK